MTPKWDNSFDRSTVEYVSKLAPKIYSEIERRTNVHVRRWPNVEPMTTAEIAEGSDTGAGHGLYFPDEKRLKLNPKMPKWQMLANFVHENCHHACPELAEHEIRELAMKVVEAVVDKKENPIKDMPGGSVSGCIKKMERRGDIDDPGAYCAAIADRIEPDWRKRRRRKKGGKRKKSARNKDVLQLKNKLLR